MLKKNCSFRMVDPFRAMRYLKNANQGQVILFDAKAGPKQPMVRLTTIKPEIRQFSKNRA